MLKPAIWTKATASNANGNCVEAIDLGNHIGVRDSKQNGSGPILLIPRGQWPGFLERAISGTLNATVFTEEGVNLHGTDGHGAPAVLWFTPAEWDAFLDGARSNEFAMELVDA